MKKTFPIGKYLFEVEFDYENKKAHYHEVNTPDLAGYFDLAVNQANTRLETTNQTYGDAVDRLWEKVEKFVLK